MVYIEKNAPSFGLEIGHQGFKAIHQQTSDYQEILVAETQRYGRALFLDGVIQSSAADEAIYHEMLVHPALAHADDAQDILVVGAGEGATLRELLKHKSVRHIDAVEIDGAMIRAAKEHLPAWHKGAFADDRVRVLECDILEHLAATGADAYDIIIVDLTDPITPDGEFCPDSLTFNGPFLAQLKKALRPDGCIAMQVGECAAALAQPLAVLGGQFGSVQLYSVPIPSFHSNWAFILLAEGDHAWAQHNTQAALTGLEQLPSVYFSRLAYLLAAEQADRFFAAPSQ
jgi:spermidine synthase